MGEILQSVFLRPCKHGIGSEEIEQRPVRCLRFRRDRFPDEDAWDRFRLLLTENTRLPHHGIFDSIATTTSHASEEEAATWLKCAFALFSDVAYAYG
jgi:hypothetical protein